MKTLQRILYAEDDSGVQAIARVALELLGGFTVCLCKDGEEALRQAPSFQPDLILLDVMMPGLSGLETLQALRNDPRLADLPVYFLTAKTLKSDVDYLLQAGASAVIGKPFDPVTLPDQLRALWSQCGRPRKTARR